MLQSQRLGPDRQDRTNCNTGLRVTGGTAVHWEPSVQGDCTLHEILKATGGQCDKEMLESCCSRPITAITAFKSHLI